MFTHGWTIVHVLQKRPEEKVELTWRCHAMSMDVGPFEHACHRVTPEGVGAAGPTVADPRPEAIPKQ